MAHWSETIDGLALATLALAAVVEMTGPDDGEVLLGIFRDVPPVALEMFGEVVFAILEQHRAYGPEVALRARGLDLARKRCGLESR